MASLNIGKVFGIEIKLHYTWFFIVLLLAWSLAVDFFPADYPGLSTTTYWVLGIIASLLLFDCVLAHELAHALVAKHHKMEVKGITLFFFGGIAQASDKGLTPKKEFDVAVAGPLFSLALGGIFFGFTLLPLGPNIYPLVDYLFKINVLLALFNLTPGFPLDGGRIFRAVAWKYMKDLKKATRLASNLGKTFGGLLVLYGFFTIMTSGLWYVLLGSFLFFLAETSYLQVELKQTLEKKKLKDVASKNFKKANPDDNLEIFLEEFMSGNSTFIVEEKGSCYLIDFDAIRKLPRHEWPIRLVSEVMVKVKPITGKEDPYLVLQKMQEQRVNVLPVVKNKKITSIITLDRLLRV